MKKLFAVLGSLILSLTILNNINAQCSSQKSSYREGAKATAASQEVNVGKDIVSYLVKSENHTTLVAAVKAASLVSTLQGEGPFTVFAPVNSAFEKLPAGTVETLLKPENKASLTKVLTYHVIAGKFDAATIVNAIKAGKGKAVLTTVSGNKLTAMMNGSRDVLLKDEKGNIANVSIYDIIQKNGVIHVIDSLVLPR